MLYAEFETGNQATAEVTFERPDSYELYDTTAGASRRIAAVGAAVGGAPSPTVTQA